MKLTGLWLALGFLLAFSSSAFAIAIGDAVDSPGLTWSASGSFTGRTAAETVTHDGMDAAHTSYYNNNQYDSMSTTVVGPGTVTFWYRVNSESGWDYFGFSGPSSSISFSGFRDWTQHTVNIPAGSHTLSWTFSTDSSVTIAGGGVWVDEFVFTTAHTSQPATAITTTSATLNGQASPDGLATTVWFEYGTSPTLTGATTSASQSIGSGTPAVTYSQAISGLLPDTRYYFRSVKSNSGGIHQANILSFSTGPEIAVEYPSGTGLVDGGSTINLGNSLTGSPSPVHAFTIRNLGAFPLTGIGVSVDGPNAASFSVSAPGASSLAPGASTTFTVQLPSTPEGASSATLRISSNDTDENPFDIALSATGVNDVSAYSFTNSSSINTYGSYTFGSEFTVNTTCTLTALGFYDHNQDGISGNNPVGLWTNSGTLLATASVNNADPLRGVFRYRYLPTPVVLAAGQTYRIGALTNGVDPTGWDGPGFALDPRISGYRSRYSDPTGALAMPIYDYGTSPTLWGAGMLLGPSGPEIVVEQPVGTNVADGGTKDFGTVNVGSTTSLTFAIKNIGTADLTGLTITKDGANAGDFTITASPTAPVSGPSGSTTFTVQFAPSGGGTRTAAIHIANNDSNENPFDINLTGTGFQTTYVWSGGGVTNNWSEGANWVGGGAPTNDGTKDIVFGASSRYTSQVDAPWAVRSIVFGSGRTSDYTLQGSTLTVGSGGIEARDAAGRYVTIGNAMTLAANQTWRQFSTTYNLRFDGPIALGGRTLTVTSEYGGVGGVGVRLAGNITGNGNLILNPGNNIYIDGSHSYVGTLTCNSGGGNVHVSSPDAFPGVVNNANNSIIFYAGHTNNRTISGPGTINYVGDQNYTITGENNYSGGTRLGYSGTPQMTLASATPFGSGYVMAWYRGAAISCDSARTFPNQLAFLHDADKAFTFGGAFPLTFTGGARLWNTARAVVTAPSLTIQGVVSTSFGTGPLVKEGAGTLVLSGATANTYTGNTTVKAGTLSLSKSAGTAAIVSGVLRVETGAIVSWAASDQVANSVNVVMSGGELNLGGRSETMGTLDLDGAAELDFGAVTGTAVAAFSNSSALNWSGGSLTVNGFVPGTTTLRFGTNATALSPAQLSLIQFTGFASGAQINSAGYVTPPGFTPPTYAGYSFSTPYQTAATVSFTKLLTMAADADGDAVSITAAGPSANGGTLAMQASSLLYTPPNGFSGTDTFPITITDADGLWVIGTVTVTVGTNLNSGGQGNNTPQLMVLSGGGIGIAFQGIPGRSYQVQRSTNLTSWTTIATVTAAMNGAVTFTDESPPPGSAFYRLRKP